MRWAWWLGIGGGVLLVALGSIVVWWVVDGWRLRRLPPTAAVIYLFQRLYRYARWLRVRSWEGDTPSEFAAALGVQLTNLAGDRRWGALLNSSPGEVDWLGDLCTRALYSLHRPDRFEQNQAIQTWNRLRRRLLLARLLTWAP
jgi:hypothetical protein